MVLKTRRLDLRPFRDDDFTALRALVADPIIFRYRSHTTITEAQTRAFLDHLKRAENETPPSMLAFALIHRETDKLIGECGLTRLADPVDEAFLWFSLKPTYWGEGLMTEAAQAVVSFGFNTGTIKRIHARCHPDNLASRRVLERLGMKRRDENRADSSPNLIYELCHKDWDSQQVLPGQK